MSPASQPALLVRNRGLLTMCLMCATLMQALDSTIANVALPYMQGSLSASADQITWVLTSYITAAAIMTAPVGWMAARFGRKNLFVACLIGFTVTSMLCGVAQSLPQMVIFRLLQGVAGAAMVPLGQAVMLDIYTPEQRGQAMAIFGIGVMFGPIIGPTLGGWLTETYNWRYVFYVNLPFGALASIGIMLFMPRTEPQRSLRFDTIGFSVLALGVGALQLMLDRGQGLDWFSDTEIIAEAIIGGLGLYLFIVHMATAEKPFIPPRLFRDTNFVAGTVVMFISAVLMMASSALIAPWLQTLAGYPVATAGLVMAPRGAGVMLAMIIGGRFVNKLDHRLVMTVAILLLMYSFWQMSLWTPDVPEREIIINTLLQGFGMGTMFLPLQVLAFVTLSPELRTQATALFSLARNLGGAVGISVLETLLVRNGQTLHAEMAQHLTPFDRVLAQAPLLGHMLHQSMARGAAMLDAMIGQQASIIAYADDFRLMLLLSIPTLALTFIVRKPRTHVVVEPAHVMD